MKKEANKIEDTCIQQNGEAKLDVKKEADKIEDTCIEHIILGITHNFLLIKCNPFLKDKILHKSRGWQEALQRDFITQAHNLLDKSGFKKYFNECKCDGNDRVKLIKERLLLQRNNFAAHYNGKKRKSFSKTNHERGAVKFFWYWVKGSKDELLEILLKLNDDVHIWDEGVKLRMHKEYTLDIYNKNELIEEVRKQDFSSGIIDYIKTNHTSREDFMKYCKSVDFAWYTLENSMFEIPIFLDTIRLLFHYYDNHYKHPVSIKATSENGIKTEYNPSPIYNNLSFISYPLFEKNYRNYLICDERCDERSFRDFLKQSFDCVHELLDNSNLRNFVWNR